jgi:hypothetical protein
MYLLNIGEIKWPFFLLVLMGIMFPILFILGIVIVLIMFVLAIPIGCLIGMYYSCAMCGNLIVILPIFLPIGVAIGGIVVPFGYTYSISGPFFIHYVRRYKLSWQGIYERCFNN